MPQLIPTLDDLYRMTPRQRQKAAKAVRAVLSGTDRFIDATLGDRQLTEDQRIHARRAVWSVMQAGQDPQVMGEKIRARARDLERDLPVEPDWVTAARRDALLQALR